MDGNGRWAKKRGLGRGKGHEAGARAIENLLEGVQELGIEVVSLYSFSKENWKRPKEEIKLLWDLLVHFFNEKIKKIQENNIRICHSGDMRQLPIIVQKTMKMVIKKTEKNTGPILNFCINYGGRQEIVNAVRLWLKKQVKDKLTDKLPKLIDESSIEENLYTSEFPSLDLVIRTSGEFRISNFLLWQLAYSEIWITSRLWPDFSEKDLFQAIIDFQKRKRRYGGV